MPEIGPITPDSHALRMACHTDCFIRSARATHSRERVSRPGRSPVHPRYAHGVPEDQEGVPKGHPHPGTTGVGPLHGNFGDMVPALLGKVEDFHIKDDASDHAFGEEFAGDITDEEFEATLGVLDTADGDGPAEDAERLAEKLAVEGWLRRMSVPSGWTRDPMTMCAPAFSEARRRGSSSIGVEKSASEKRTTLPRVARMALRRPAPLPSLRTDRRTRTAPGSARRCVRPPRRCRLGIRHRSGLLRRCSPVQ